MTLEQAMIVVVNWLALSIATGLIFVMLIQETVVPKEEKDHAQLLALAELYVRCWLRRDGRSVPFWTADG